jgi:hypothetical protein
MITNPSFLLSIAYLRQQEMLQQAEAERRYGQLKRNRPGLLRQASHRLADVVLIWKSIDRVSAS